MKFKKLLASSLLCTLCMFSSLPVFAAEVSEPDTNIQQTKFHNVKDCYTKLEGMGYFP